LLVASPIPNQESKTVAKSFVTNVICQYGTPDSILSDQGTNFMEQLFKDICKLLSIKKLHSTSYHPQTQGSVERSHRTINEYEVLLTKTPIIGMNFWAGDDCADMTCYNPGSLKLPVIHRYDCAGTKFNPITGRVIRKVPVPVCK
jgi:transposase InsO family protein